MKLTCTAPAILILSSALSFADQAPSGSKFVDTGGNLRLLSPTSSVTTPLPQAGPNNSAIPQNGMTQPQSTTASQQTIVMPQQQPIGMPPLSTMAPQSATPPPPQQPQPMMMPPQASSSQPASAVAPNNNASMPAQETKTLPAPVMNEAVPPSNNTNPAPVSQVQSTTSH